MGFTSVNKLTEFFRALMDKDEPETLSFAAGRVTKVECARSGEFTAMGGKRVKFTPDGLKGIAENFAEPRKLKIGHGAIQTDTPNAGQVTGLSYDEKRDRLIATVKPTEYLAAQNRSGAFERVSMELVPKGDGFALDAIGFLGAHDPAITDLEPVAFAAGQERVILCCGDGEEKVIALALTATERKKIDAADFAQPPDGYPIDTQAHLDAAATLIGKAPANEQAAIKARAIRIAKKNGLTLPQSWETETPAEEKSKGEETDKKMAAAKESDMEKLELAEARIKAMEAREKALIASDVQVFLASDKITKKMPLSILKGAEITPFLSALAALSDEHGKVMFAGTDGKEVASNLYETAKRVLLSLPDKLAGADEKEIALKGRAAEEEEVKRVSLVGVDPDSAKSDMEIQKQMFASKAKGETITYLEAARRVELATSAR